MISKEKLNRINELAKKSKTSEGLTPEEIKERDQLRKEYIGNVRKSLKAQLDNITIVSDENPENWTEEEKAHYNEVNERLKKEFEEEELKKNVEITKKGNPGNPIGVEGKLMLQRMNQSHKALVDWTLEHINIQNPGSILDIGCGGGATLKNLSQRFPYAKLFGIDQSDVSIETTKEFDQNLIKNGTLELTKGDAYNLPYKQDTFGLVVTVETYYFLKDLEKFFKQVLRVLKPDGYFLLLAEEQKSENLSDMAKDQIKNNKMVIYSADEVINTLEKSGFTDILYQENPVRGFFIQAKKPN